MYFENVPLVVVKMKCDAMKTVNIKFLFIILEAQIDRNKLF